MLYEVITRLNCIRHLLDQIPYHEIESPDIELPRRNREAAASHLQDAVRRRDPGIVIFARGWAGMEPLQALPEFQAILRDIGVTQRAAREGRITSYNVCYTKLLRNPTMPSARP